MALWKNCDFACWTNKRLPQLNNYVKTWLTNVCTSKSHGFNSPKLIYEHSFDTIEQPLYSWKNQEIQHDAKDCVTE